MKKERIKIWRDQQRNGCRIVYRAVYFWRGGGQYILYKNQKLLVAFDPKEEVWIGQLSG